MYDVTTDRPHKIKGKTPAETKANTLLAFPVTHIIKDSPPFFVTHGTGDKIVDISYSRDLVKILEERRVPPTYMEIEVAPHTYHLHPKEKDIRPDVIAFLKKHL